jgi:hypothetical protein
VPPPLGAPRTPPLTAPPPGSPGAPRAPPAGPSSVLAAEQSRKVPPAAACRLVSRDRAAPPEDVAVETEAVVEGRSGKEGLGLSGERVRCGSITIWCRGGAAAGGGRRRVRVESSRVFGREQVHEGKLVNSRFS